MACGRPRLNKHLEYPMSGSQVGCRGTREETTQAARQPCVLAVIDGHYVTGPAKQLLAAAEHGRPNFATSLVMFQRPRVPTPLIEAARHSRLPLTVLRERWVGDPMMLRRFAQQMHRTDVDIVQTHGYKATILAFALRGRARKPWVAFLHGETYENLKVRAYFHLEWIAARRADRLVVVSQALARTAMDRQSPGDRIRVVHNAALAAGPRDHSEPLSTSDRTPAIAVVGRLSREKGIDIAIDVHAAVLRTHPSARLLIVGEGPERSRLEADIARLGIGHAVEWLGHVDDTAPVYRRSAVLLLPSRSEGLPNVVLEAMAHGIPVVAAAVGGVPEIVRDGANGFLVTSGDAAAMAARIVALLRDPSARREVGRRGQGDVAARFSMEARVAALTRLYEELRP